MPPFAPGKKRKVAFETDVVGDESTASAKLKKRKLKEIVKKVDKTKDSPGSESTQCSSSFKVIAGSYEKILYGLQGQYDRNSKTATLKPVFIFPAHLSCIKSLAASPNGGKWLATGSADEVIKVWDLKKQKEFGGLVQHEGSITHLCFPTRSHLFSASEDGTITIFQVKDWIPVRSLKGHKGRINSLAIHPGLKAALSVGKDKHLRMWDLTKGKSVASVNINKEGEVIRWSTSGKHFAVLSGTTIEVYSTDMKLKQVINHPSRLHDFRFLPLKNDAECLLIAAEDKKVSVYAFIEGNTTETGSPFATFVGHSNRVKSIDIFRLKLDESTSIDLLITVSSDGLLNLHDTSMLKECLSSENKDVIAIDPIGSYNTNGTRLTCVTFAENGSSKPSTLQNEPIDLTSDILGSP